MNFKILTKFDAISEQEWDALLLKSACNSPFLRYGYQRIWWEHKGGREWPQAELRIITARDINGELVGIAPFFIGKKNGADEVYFIGSIEISDYLDFIVHPDNSAKFIRGLFSFIKSKRTEFCRIIQLVNIPENSPSLSVMKEIGSTGEWAVGIKQAYHTPVIRLADSWETYLMGIDKKQRHEIRRKMRRAESTEDDVSWYISDDKAALDHDITAFLRLMGNDEEKKRFLTNEMRGQMDAIIHWAAGAGYLQLSFLTINSEKAAGYLCFDYEGKIWVYNSGFSPGFQYYSPGWVLLSYLIQNAIGNGKTHFDFMRGNETYKYRFGAVDSFVMRVKAELLVC